MRRSRSVLIAAAALLTLPIPASNAQSDGSDVPVGPRYNFFAVGALADGVAADFEIIGFLPIEGTGISSITSEARFGVSRSDALAALPDPGDLILTLPSTLAALTGVSGIPDYAAASRAEYPETPEDEVRLAPDASLGGFTLRTTAGEDGSSATAFVGNQVDTVGLIPSFSIGSVKTTAETHRIHGTAFETVATTTVNDLRLLGSLVRIKQITTEVRLRIVDGNFEVHATDAAVSGADLAGMPIGITDDGIVGLGQPAALAPVIDLLAKPISDLGIRIHTTPASESIDGLEASGTAGTVDIEVPLDVQGYPATLTLSIGRASADIDVAGLNDGTSTTVDDSFDSGGGSFDSGGDFTSGSFDSGFDSTTGTTSRTRTGTGGGDDGGGGQLVALPAPRTIADFDVVPLYRGMLFAGLLMFAATWLVIRTSRRAGTRSDLRHLWRW